MSLPPHLTRLQHLLTSSPLLREDHRTFFLQNLTTLSSQQVVELTTHLAQGEQAFVALFHGLTTVRHAEFWRELMPRIGTLLGKARDNTEAVHKKDDALYAEHLVDNAPKSE